MSTMSSDFSISVDESWCVLCDVVFILSDQQTVYSASVARRLPYLVDSGMIGVQILVRPSLYGMI